MKYLLVTDIPAPWREKVYQKVFEYFGNDFHVVYCNYNEKRRLWTFQLGNHPKTFLKSITIRIKEKERYFNLGIIPFLLKNRPKVVVCFSLQPIIFLTFFISKLIRSKIVILSDAWLEKDSAISPFQKMGRKLAYNYFADAFIGASKQTLEMYKFYNKTISTESLFLSWLCADNEYFEKYIEGTRINKKYDLMLSGRIVDIKNPLFFVNVAKKVKEKIGRCSVLVIGDGDEKLKKQMLKIFKDNQIDYHFPGFIKHNNLPEYYSQAKLLLLPTSGDCWGVVINEAMVSGLPVITTNMTAAAGELVLDGQNGFVLPLNSDLWAEKILRLLKNTKELEAYSKCAKETVTTFDFEKAAEGIIASIEYLDKK